MQNAQTRATPNLELSIVIPCLNEVETIAIAGKVITRTNALIVGGVSWVLGLQAVAILSRLYSAKVKLLPNETFWRVITHYLALDRCLIIAAILIVAGLGATLTAGTTLQIVGLLSIITGSQTLFTSFVVSLLRIEDMFD